MDNVSSVTSILVWTVLPILSLCCKYYLFFFIETSLANLSQQGFSLEHYPLGLASFLNALLLLVDPNLYLPGMDSNLLMWVKKDLSPSKKNLQQSFIICLSMTFH